MESDRERRERKKRREGKGECTGKRYAWRMQERVQEKGVAKVMCIKVPDGEEIG